MTNSDSIPPHLGHLLRLLDRVEGSGGRWRACCPAHDDRTPSLSIAVGEGGQILLKCFANCTIERILASLNLTLRDLRPDGGGYDTRRRSRITTKPSARAFATIEEAAQQATPSGHHLVATWSYFDADRVAVLWICRYNALTSPTDGKKPAKTFRAVHRAATGFVLGDPSGPLPPYRLPELRAAPAATVFITEGERKADLLGSLELIATTTAHGAQSPKKTDLSALAGRDVVILPDNDASGMNYARSLVDLLQALTPPACVRIVNLPDLPTKGDVVEFVADRRANGKSDAEIRGEIELLSNQAKDSGEPPKIADPTANSPFLRPLPRPLTDSGNAERLADRHGSDLRHVQKWRKFLTWDGRRWRIDDRCCAMAWTKDVARSIWIEVAKASTEEERNVLIRFARTSESARRRHSMLDLVSAENGIAITHDALDVNPMLLNVRNGTFDLQTGRLGPHRREDLITRLAPIKYDAKATAPLWTAFLERVVPVEAVRKFLQRAIGLSLTGDATEHYLFFVYGLGANGKSVFLRVIHALLGGDYAFQAKSDLLLTHQHRGHPTEFASLFGKRLVTCNEFGAGRKFDEVVVKQLTGDDLITARRMREDEWTFPPTHKLFIAGNHKPRIEGTDLGIWRRILLIPFLVTIPDNERDRHLVTKLCSELPGILNWALDGCLLWQRGGLQPPEEVLAATAGYREEMDILADFLADRCTIQPSAKVTARDLYAAYTLWSSTAGSEALTQQAFGTKLSERGLSKRKTNGVYLYVGIGLKPYAPT